MVVYFAWPCLAKATDFTMDELISAVGVGSGSTGEGEGRGLGEAGASAPDAGRRKGFVLLPRILPHSYSAQSGEDRQSHSSLCL